MNKRVESLSKNKWDVVREIFCSNICFFKKWIREVVSCGWLFYMKIVFICKMQYFF